MKGAGINRHATSKVKNELKSFLGILNYMGKFSSMTAEACETLQKLTSAKAEWPWNKMYQDLYDKAKMIIKRCMYEVL